MNYRSAAWPAHLMMCVALAGCAGAGAMREGQALLDQGHYEQGLARLQEALRQAPDNTAYKTTLALRREGAVASLLASAEQARRQQQDAQAETAWQRVLAIAPGNETAQQGLAWLAGRVRRQRLLEEATSLLEREGEMGVSAAADMLARVVQEDPGHTGVAALKAAIAQRRSQAAQASPRLGARYRRPVSLVFRDAPLRAVLEVMARETGINFYYDREVRPDIRATVLAQETSVEDVLRLVLATNQLAHKVLNENSILVYPDNPQKTKDYQDMSVRSFYVANADVKAVANTIKALVKTRDLVVDERLGVLFMRDTPQAIRMAERIVALQDLEDPEVMLEVEIVEVARQRLLDLGLQWPEQLTLAPLQRNGAALTLRDLGALNSSNVQVQGGSWPLKLRQNDGDINVLANPRIRVRNKERAKIQIGERLPIVTTTSTTTGFLAESVNYVDVGLKLEVEPSVHMDNEVAIRINLEVSNQGKAVPTKSGSIAYQIGTRGASTMLRLRDGETQVLAGLIQDSDRRNAERVPLLGEIPLLGRLFGSQRDNGERTEILLSITPRVLRAPRRPSLAQSLFSSGTESRIGDDPLLLPPSPAGEGGAGAGAAGTVTAPAPAMALPANVPEAGPPGLAGAFSWQVRETEVKAGGQWNVSLKLNASEPLRDVEARIGYDPAVLEVLAVHEGDFFARGRAPTRFVHRVDAQQGRIFVQAERPDESEQHGLASGSGDVLVVSFRARKAAASTRVSLLSIRPEPEPATAIALPAPAVLVVRP